MAADFKAQLSFKVWVWAWEGVELQTTTSDSVTASRSISTRYYVTTAFSSPFDRTFNLRSAATGTHLYRSKSNLTATRFKKKKKKKKRSSHKAFTDMYNIYEYLMF